MRIVPYRTIDNIIDGVVITFVDIHEQKKSQETAQSRLYVEYIAYAVQEPLIVLDKDLRVVSANRSFYSTFQVTKEDTLGKLIYDLGNRQWDIPRLRELLEKVIPNTAQLSDFPVEHDFPNLGHRSMTLNACRIDFKADREKLILLTINDVTDSKKS